MRGNSEVSIPLDPIAQRELAKVILPCVQDLTAETLDRFKSLIPSSLPRGSWEHSEPDRADALVHLFVMAEWEHLRSVLDLARLGHHRDAAIVSRTSLEGLIQLLWILSPEGQCSDDGPSRSDLWFCYAAVEDWRQLQQIREEGREVAEDQDAAAARLLGKWGGLYLQDRPYKAKKAGRALPVDPYRRTWEPISISQMFDEVAKEYEFGRGKSSDPAESKREDALKRHWKLSSEWAHWNPRALLRTLDLEGSAPNYTLDDPREGARALAMALFSLLYVLRLSSDRFGLKLSKITNDYFDRLADCEFADSESVLSSE